MRTVTVRGVCLGEGATKIIVPVTGASPEELRAAAARAAACGPDLIEWRADGLREIFQPQARAAALGALRQAVGEIPVLFTFRTAAEGGERAAGPEEYRDLVLWAAGDGRADLVDVELFSGPGRGALVSAARACGRPVVASSHDFSRTPDDAELARRLRAMEESGADIAKLAVTPRCPQDVLRLMQAGLDFAGRDTIPCIAISMGDLGRISRAAGIRFGSAATFGSAGRASAPGQLAVRELRAALCSLGEQLRPEQTEA